MQSYLIYHIMPNGLIFLRKLGSQKQYQYICMITIVYSIFLLFNFK